MAVYICKMCGGKLEIHSGKTVAECEYCGSLQTVPSLDSEKKITLLSRANKLRAACQFDKAAGLYESVVAEFPEEAECYWGLVLCKYGIEYVDDPVTGKKIPTCHRTLPGTILEDPDYRSALKKADIVSEDMYQKEAVQINEIQRNIHAVVAQAEPYDVFICYKETDDLTGLRTRDSEDAQDIYTELSTAGYRVFFSRITLKSIAGSAYEPYIYAALTSAKVMLVLGSQYDYFDAVWVKNEWGRFLDMMRHQPDKLLIPCCRNLDAYDIPRELRNLPVMDVGDMMFLPSLKKKLEHIIPLEKLKHQINLETDAPVIRLDNLIKRTEMFLEKMDWEKAAQYAGNVLELDKEYTKAYLLRLLARMQVQEKSDLVNVAADLEQDPDYQSYLARVEPEEQEQMRCYAAEASRWSKYRKALEMGRSESAEIIGEAVALLDTLNGWRDSAQKREELEAHRKDILYTQARIDEESRMPEKWLAASEVFSQIPGWKDADQRRERMIGKYKDHIYQQAKELMAREEGQGYDPNAYHVNRICPLEKKIQEYDQAIEYFRSILPWKDAQKQIQQCDDRKSRRIYQEGMTLFDTNEPDKVLRSADYFARVKGWKDSDQMLLKCRTFIQQYYQKRQRQIENGISTVRKGLSTLLILAAAMAFAGLIVFKPDAVTAITGLNHSYNGFAVAATVLMSMPVLCAIVCREKNIRVAGVYIHVLRIRTILFWMLLVLVVSFLFWGFLDIIASYLSFIYNLFGLILKGAFLYALVNLGVCVVFQFKSGEYIKKLERQRHEDLEKWSRSEKIIEEKMHKS